VTLVVDASVVVPAALTGTWDSAIEGEAKLAPGLLWSESAAVVRQLHYRNEIAAGQVRAALNWLTTTSIEAMPSQSLIADAVELASRLGWATTYDAEYVVLAQRGGLRLATLDARLRRAVGHLVEVVGPAGR
jgi:predicted nucleic acid-binding protein